MNTKFSNIRVLVARSLAAIEAGQCDDVAEGFDSIKEAKVFAKHALTDAYQHSAEMSEPMNVARIKADERGWYDDVIVADFYRKGYVEAVAAEQDEAMEIAAS